MRIRRAPRVMFALAAITLGLVFSFPGPNRTSASSEEQRVAAVERVIDGDTFVVAGGDRIRVRNFDTPELRRYRCASERRRAVEARTAAEALLENRLVTLAITDRDRYGRIIADVTLHLDAVRVDFVVAMTARGHGARWRYGAEPKPDWCPQRAVAAL